MDSKKKAEILKGVILSRYKSIRQFSVAMNIPYSTLITALERELGITLFMRSQKGMKLTAEGSEMLPLVRAYLTHEEEIYTFAAELKGVTRGKITIATYPSIATTWLPEIVSATCLPPRGFICGPPHRVRESLFESPLTGEPRNNCRSRSSLRREYRI